MSKEKNKTMTPKLRFPEFREEPPWDERKLSEVLKEHGSKSNGTEEVFSVSVHKGIINQIEHLGRSFSAATTDHYKRVLPGDIVYTKSPTGDFPYGIIKQSKISKPVIVSPLYGVFSPETIALGCILDAYFESPANTINYLSSIIQKGAKNTINISNETFLSKALFLPSSKPEQQKIATTLSSLDDLIAAQNQKIKALQTHKKGLMQLLFPAEGERTPRARFGEFEGEWEEACLEDVAHFSSGGTPSKDLPDYWGGTIPWISAASMYSTTIEKSQINITEKAVRDGARIAKKGSLLVLVRGSMLYNRIPMGVSTRDLAFNQDVKALTLDKSVINFFLLFQLLAGEARLMNLVSATGIGAGKIDSAELKKFLIYIPSQKEQQKIANFFSSLDDLITTQTQKLEALKMHKKGLMQQLFPNPSE